MSNWALELQGFDIVRIWIRGEANIIADAPSRAPWENALAMHLPIPDMPLRDLIKQMYQDPDGLEVLVDDRKKQVLGDESVWEPLEDNDVEYYGSGHSWQADEGNLESSTEVPSLDSIGEEGYMTP